MLDINVYKIYGFNSYETAIITLASHFQVQQ